MQNTEATKLFSKYQAGQCTPEETAIVENWLTFGEATPFNLSGKELEEDLEDIRLSIPMFNETKRRILWPLIAAAASVFIVAGAGLFFYLNHQNGRNVTLAHDISPGGNIATLTLANGNTINLSNAANGEIAKQQGINITKTADGQLVYSVSDKATNNSNLQTAFNTISTPAGGQYQVVLPDGSKVWLNAVSSLKFPSTFSKLAERKVKLSGEAYFEVAKDKAHPFIVESNKQLVEVLGTHFNISNYTDEAVTKTTLLEGSVRVSTTSSATNDIVLKPGEQALLNNNGINVIPVDVQAEVAWKDGYFKFTDEPIQEIMQQLARWYNVEVKYEGKVTEELFNGRISRSKNISQVLKMIEAEQSVHFKIEGRRITVIK